MSKIKVCLLFGGRSAEHEVSITSARSIYANLKPDKFDIVSVYIAKSGNWRIVESPQLSAKELNADCFFSFLPWADTSPATKIEADIYFPVLHGPYGEDGTIQGFFEMADVPYVGAAVLASSAGMDKVVSKALFRQWNLPVVNYSVLWESDWRNDKKESLVKIREAFDLPLFVKPTNLGSSIGISKVTDFQQLDPAIEEAFQFDRRVMIEEGILGRELECSVMGNESAKASLPGEIMPFHEFYDYQDKYIDGKTSFGIPAELPPEIIKEIQRISVEAFKSIDGSGMARVDFFLQDLTQKIYLNEINTIPGFTEISMYPKLWEVSGLPYSQLLEELISLGFERHNRRKKGEQKFLL
ncbi:D-alanine--D-alanine ligase family protein [Acidobacteriota bacterium]